MDYKKLQTEINNLIEEITKFRIEKKNSQYEVFSCDLIIKDLNNIKVFVSSYQLKNELEETFKKEGKINVDEFFKNIENHYACEYCINKHEFNDSNKCKGCKYNQSIELRQGLDKFKKR